MQKRNFTAIFLLLCFIAAIVVSGCGKKVSESEQGKKAVPVKVESLSARNLSEYRYFTGTVEAKGQVVVTAKMAGKVKEVLVKAGDKVRAGQVLVKLDEKDVISQVEQARAAYDAAEANYNRTKAQLDQELKRLESSVRQAEENYKNVSQNYERMKKLYEEGAVSQKDFEAIQLQYNVTKEQYESAKEQLELTKASTMPETLAATKSQVEQARAALSAAQSALENTLITSPVDGTIGSVDAKVGQFISPGSIVAVVGDTGSFFVKISVTEDVINSVKVGQTAEVAVDSIDATLKATVTSTSPYKDIKTGLYPVELRIENPPSDLKPGMFARVKIAVITYENVLAVPEECVLNKEDKKIVYTIEQNKAKANEVVVGPTVEGYTIIEKGLNEGSTVVIEGQEYLEDGSPVEVVGKEVTK
ncbi:efflux RND transporter periplasmic adaptor subunit [Thermovorax subterraneus]|nr:efflux RND transporter periplasmic adaptor subunit [Thermovorax subterraneus]